MPEPTTPITLRTPTRETFREFLTPATVAFGEIWTEGEIEKALLAYQQAGFEPPTSVISLPTHGVLGEAVLGCCPSAEKIDLTRFWNWQDSASDAAPTIAPVSLPTTSPSLTTGMQAPNSLTNLPSLINNVLAAPTPESGGGGGMLG